MEDLHGLFYRAVVGFLGYDEIDVDVRVDKITVGGASYCTLDAHQTMLLRPLQHRLAVQVLAVTWIINIRADPADILATTEAPLAQAESAHVQAVATTAPQEHEAPVGRHFADIQLHYLRTNEPGLITTCERRISGYNFHSLFPDFAP